MASSLYDTGRNLFARGDFEWKANTTQAWRCALITSNYTPATTHESYTNATGNNPSPAVSSYQANAAATIVAANMSSTGGVCNAANITYSTVTTMANTINKVIIYVTSATLDSIPDPMCCWIEFTAVTPNGGDITIQWDTGTNKIFKL